MGGGPGRGRAESLYRLRPGTPSPWQDVGVPTPTPAPVTGPHLSRRRFVAASAGLVGMAAAGGCALREPTREPDPLLALAAAAGRDALELGAADASHGPDAPRLVRIGLVRRVHADRLNQEIRRLNPPEPSGTSTTGENLRPAPVCPPLAEVRQRLRADARRAAELATASEGYRAELCAAVAAACTAAVEVVLA